MIFGRFFMIGLLQLFMRLRHVLSEVITASQSPHDVRQALGGYIQFWIPVRYRDPEWHPHGTILFWGAKNWYCQAVPLLAHDAAAKRHASYAGFQRHGSLRRDTIVATLILSLFIISSSLLPIGWLHPSHRAASKSYHQMTALALVPRVLPAGGMGIRWS